MQLIVFAGLPGTGKSTVAEAVGRELRIAVFAKDWLEAVLRQHGLHATEPEKSLGHVGYELLTSLATRQLMLGQSVILDSVASTETIREQWQALATEYSAEWRVIECIWSDEAAHHAKLAQRQRNIPGWHELDWSEVERVKGYYALWAQEHLVLDAALPMAQNIRAALDYLSAR